LDNRKPLILPSEVKIGVINSIESSFSVLWTESRPCDQINQNEWFPW